MTFIGLGLHGSPAMKRCVTRDVVEIRSKPTYHGGALLMAGVGHETVPRERSMSISLCSHYSDKMMKLKPKLDINYTIAVTDSGLLCPLRGTAGK